MCIRDSVWAAAGAGAAGAGALGAGLAAAAPFAIPAILGAKMFGLFRGGTPMVPDMNYGPDPLMMKGGGYAGWKHYANGMDSVPAMLTPGEAVIPAGAAQDPMNKPMINGMIEQGRAMNQGMPAEAPAEAMIVAGPLSGKTKREEMKLLQDMSLKKKSWTMDEKRKQEAHEQKMKMDKMKGALAMKQSQE